MSSNPNVSNTPVPLAFAAPTIQEALDDETGLIPARIAGDGITLELNGGGITRPTDWMTVELRRVEFPPAAWTTLVPPFVVGPTPITRFIPAPPPEFQHGLYEIKNTQYRNAGGLPGEAFDESDPAPFRVDTIAPYAVATSREEPTAPIFANAPPGTVIDNAFLITEGGLRITIPPNTYGPQTGRFEPGDRLDIYYSTVMNPRPQDLVSGTGVPMTATGATFFLPADQITLSGMYYIFYTITDRAGNTSRPSFNDFRAVALLDDPVLLEAFLPLAPAPRDGSTDDLLDIADFLQGIDVHIEDYLNNAPGTDRFEVQWEAQPFGPQSAPLSTFPVVFTNMNDAIKAAYTATLGPQSVTVRYRVDRGGVFFLSPPKTVRLDLSVEGPALPETLEPGDVNPALNLAQVFGTGPTPVLNELHIQDANLPVRIDIPLWDIAALPHANNQFYLLWGASQERVGPFNLSTVVPGATATFEIPWDVVARHGNGPQRVSYLVTGPGTTNENPSGVTTVNVIDAVTVVLAPAEYSRLDVNDEWSCQSLLTRTPGSPPVLYAELFIPGDPRLVVGNTVTVTLTISNDFPGLPAGPFTETITTAPLTADNVANGVNVQVTYRPFLAQVPFGPAEVTYTTEVDTGAIGRGQPAEAYTGFSNPNSYCDGVEFLP
ncbi:hypothetical protein [uncultured Pseudomonas sp.]|uniref:hypothetical protein n=1 Tax=uncultured Pseudomonas sp. TaxID=114707 RepID=UPI0025DB9855|nr:hypothetical protein [uncultured Pseudomonas sp.]